MLAAALFAAWLAGVVVSIALIVLGVRQLIRIYLS